MHEGDAVAELCLVHEMGGDEDRHVVVAGEVGKDLPERVARDGIDAGGRLVEDEDVRRVDEGDRERQPLPDAERHFVGQLVHEFGKLEPFAQGLDPVRNGVRCHAEQFCMKLKVLMDGEFRIEGEGLAHVADAAAHIDVLGIDLVAEQSGLAIACRQETGQDLHGRRLAAAVRTQEAEDFSAPDAEADVIDGGEVAEADGHMFRFDGDIAIGLGGPFRDDDLVVIAACFRRQKRDEGGVEIGSAGLPEKLVGRAGGEHVAVVHGHEPVEACGFLHIGGRDNDAHAGSVPADIVDQLPELPARQRIDAGRRLVQDEKVGVVDQRAAQAGLLLHATGEFPGKPVGEFRHAGARKQRSDTTLALGLVVAEEPSEEVDVLEDREGGIEVLSQSLRHIGDAGEDRLAMSCIGDIAAQHVNPPRWNDAGTGEQRQEAGFADAIRPDEADHAPGRHIQCHVSERVGLAIGEIDALDAGDVFLIRGAFWRRRHRHWTVSARLAGQLAAGSIFT